MNYKYHKVSQDNSVEAECPHCFLTQICKKHQNLAYNELSMNSNAYKEYIDKIILRKEESEYLCEDYIEFRRYSDEGINKALTFIKKRGIKDDKIFEDMLCLCSLAYNEGFKRALDITINNGE